MKINNTNISVVGLGKLGSYFTYRGLKNQKIKNKIVID
jgi:hypothetical protein